MPHRALDPIFLNEVFNAVLIIISVVAYATAYLAIEFLGAALAAIIGCITSYIIRRFIQRRDYYHNDNQLLLEVRPLSLALAFYSIVDAIMLVYLGLETHAFLPLGQAAVVVLAVIAGETVLAGMIVMVYVVAKMRKAVLRRVRGMNVKREDEESDNRSSKSGVGEEV